MRRKMLQNTMSMVLSILIIFSCFPVSPANAETAPEIYDLTVSNTDQQTVKGWGVTPSWNRSDWNRNFIDRTAAQQALLQDLGVSMFRTMIPAVAGDGDGNLIDVKMQEIYDLIHVSEDKGVHDYIISVWSPPVGMKTLPTVNGWTGTEHVRLRPDKEEAYTNYLVNAIQWLVAKGASVPKALSFQNEPLSQIISEWCYWGGDNGAQFQRVTKLLRAKLDAAGYTSVQILAPEGATYHENELLLGQGLSALNTDSALNNAIGGLASHSYFSKGYDTTEVYQKYRDALDNFPEKDRWQTEYSTLIAGVSEMDMAINASRRLASDMAFIRNNYWFWWLGWANGRHPTDVGEVLLDGDGYTVTKSKAFYVLSKIFNNVPVGSKVRYITSDAASGITTSDSLWMDSVAFVNGNKTVALVVNSTDQAKTVNLKGLTGSTASIYQLTSSVGLGKDMQLASSKNIHGGTASMIGLPAKSVSVIITSDSDTAPPQVTFDQSNSSSIQNAAYAVRNSQFTVSGHLDEAGTLLINGEAVTVASDLSFSKLLNLQPVSNTISAVATDTLGNAGSPAQLIIRHDPAYLGITLDQNDLTYVNQSGYTISGKTNGNATVKINQQHNGATVSEGTYSVVVEQNSHQVGDTIQPIFNDSFVSAGVLGSAQGGFSVNSGYVIDSSTVLAPAEGLKSMRLKLTAGVDLARVGINFVNTSSKAVLKNLSGLQSTAGLQFWVYTKKKVDSFSVVLDSDNNGIGVEARVPLSNYLSAADYGNKWVKVTVPFADFSTSGVYYDTASGQTTTVPFQWDKVKGIGFSSSTITSGYYDPYVDDIRIVYTSESSTPTAPSSFTTILNLREGENTVTASAYNDLGQQAVPATLRVIYDSIAPVITVPSSGSTTSTSYVLKGSVSEAAALKINSVPTNLAADKTFTAVVPVTKGLNAITVAAEDPAGNQSQVIVNVDCNPVVDGALTPGVTASNHASGALAIDGNLMESGWVINNSVGKMITGTSDNNITFGTMWDETNFYVGVKVLDANLINDSDPAKTYQDDSVEIYIDGDNSRSSSYGIDDHQITLGWHDQQLSAGGGIPGVTFAQKDIDGGFTVEMAIPWAGVGITPPKTGSVIGFDVGYNDDDGHNNGSRESQTMWRGSGNNWQSTAAFGSLYLNDGKNVTVALEPSGALTIDGSLNEPYWALRSNVVKAITGSSNNSVRFGTLGDTQNLYVGIEVVDPSLKNDSAQAYQDDSVEIYIDADHNQSTSYDSKDHQITLGWHDNQLSMIGGIQGIQYAQKDISGGYTVEMAIPWSGLNVTPARDISLGFDIGNNDDDGQNSGNRESQLMWNGIGDNWRNTSAFGHLLLHNLSLPLPQTTDPEPEGLVEFTDNAADLTKVYAKTANIVTASGHPENFSGDADRFAHRTDNPTSPEYVIYKSPFGDIYSIDIATGLFNGTPAFSIYGSADGVNFAKITPKSTLTGGANGYSVFSNTSNKLGTGIKYLKIEFPGKENWKEQLLNISFKYAGEPPGPPEDAIKAVFTDEAANLSKLNAKSGHIGTASGQPEKYGNDSTRIIHTNDDAINPEYIIYKSPDADIYSFDILVSAFYNLPATSVFAVYGSKDGLSFSKIPASSTMVSSASGFNTLNYKAASMARGYKYLKVEFPYGTVNDDNWTSSINKVSFVYGATSIPVTGVTLDQASMSLNIGATTTLAAAVAPDNATNKAVTWSSSNPAVVSVDSNGTLTAVGVGTATVTVTTTDGSKTADCTVEVLPVLDQVTLSADKTAITSASTAALSVGGIMSDGSQADLSQAQIVYTSDNEQVAKVDGSGIVTAIGEGKAAVKASVSLRGVNKEGSTQIIVDNTAPITSTAVDKIGNNGWYNSDVTVTLSAVDNLSGVEKTEYRIGDSGGWITYSAPITLTVEGLNAVQYRSADKAGNVEDIQQLAVQIDKTLPSYNLTVNGNVLNEGGTFDDNLPLTFLAWDSLSGIAFAMFTIDGTDYKIDPAVQSSKVIDLAGKAGSYTATIIAEDMAGNKLEKPFLFTVTTSIGSIRKLMDLYIQSGELGGSLAMQLSNNLDQAQHQLDKGSSDQAAKQMQDFVKHLNNEAVRNNISAKAKEILNADANTLIELWSGGTL
jgi:O-glycosyl hydrolase